jgi:predicted transcriptional regulator
VNAAGELPSTQLSSISAFDGAQQVFEDGLPWLYRNAPFPLAAFLDKFLSTYGLILTTLFLVLAVTDNIGLVKPWHLVRRSRQPRMRLIAQSIAERVQKSGTLTQTDRRKLAAIERWIKSQNQGLDEVQDLVTQVMSTPSSPTPRGKSGN